MVKMISTDCSPSVLPTSIALATLAGLVILGASCGKSTAPNGLDGGCVPACVSTNQICVNKVCQAAAAEGSPCGTAAPDGGPTACLSGLDCDLVAGGVPVCSRSCTAPSDCPNGGTCFARPAGASGKAYCANPVGIGSKCNDEALQQCTASVANQLVNCISVNGGAGVCFERCGAGVSCPSGQDCTTAFSDGLGVCASSTDAGSSCNQAQLQFCTGGQECVVESSSSQGVCHLPCTGTDGGCPTAQSCVPLNPCNPNQMICVYARIQGQVCDPSFDDFCSNETDCVNLNGELLCQPDCSSGQTCPDGTACNPLPEDDGGAGCRSACF